MSHMVHTVLGMVDTRSLGTTLIHEHLYVKPSELPKHYDYTLDSVEKSVEEACLFKKAGGGTLVEMTPINFGRNTEALRHIALRSGVNVVCTTGFHKEEHLPRWFDELRDAELANVISDEIEGGIGLSHVRPGAIKVGTSLNTITGREKRAIAVCAPLARDYGLPLITHADQGTMALEQIELLANYGANPEHICVSHTDLTLDIDYLERICDTGASISFDHVGRDLDTGDDARISILARLVCDGYGDRVCLAGDMGRKTYFASYGGKPGLGYILTELRDNALQRMNAEDYDRMITVNPQRMLSQWSA